MVFAKNWRIDWNGNNSYTFEIDLISKKKLAQAVGAGKSEICRAAWQIGGWKFRQLIGQS